MSMPMATLKHRIVPSLLSANFAHLARDLQLIQKAGAESVQIDVMDGHFVPNISMGAPIVASLRRVTRLSL